MSIDREYSSEEPYLPGTPRARQALTRTIERGLREAIADATLREVDLPREEQILDFVTCHVRQTADGREIYDVRGELPLLLSDKRMKRVHIVIPADREAPPDIPDEPIVSRTFFVRACIAAVVGGAIIGGIIRWNIGSKTPSQTPVQSQPPIPVTHPEFPM